MDADRVIDGIMIALGIVAFGCLVYYGWLPLDVVIKIITGEIS